MHTAKACRRMLEEQGGRNVRTRGSVQDQVHNPCVVTTSGSPAGAITPHENLKVQSALSRDSMNTT